MIMVNASIALLFEHMFINCMCFKKNKNTKGAVANPAPTPYLDVVPEVGVEPT